MSDTYADLRALAEAATPGPWLSSHNITAGTWDVSVLYSNGIGVVIADMRKREADSAFIAAANPARICTLLADLDAARAEVDRLRQTIADRDSGALRAPLGSFERHTVSELARQRDALAAKVEALTAEVERVRGQLSSYKAWECSCGHPRTSHTPLDFADCSECPHGTCSNTIPGLKWDIWHRDTMVRRDALADAVRNIVELLDPANGMAAEVNPRGVRYFDERDIAACLSALDGTP